jgi:uncharacterized protein (TIGR04255 family)
MNTKDLLNPPIKEAVFDVRFKTGTISFQEIELFSKGLNYDVQEMEAFTLQAKVSDLFENKLSTNKEKSGVRINNISRNTNVQLTTEGLSFFVATGYEGWDKTFNSVTDFLLKFSPNFNDVLITRVALRYINVFDIEFGDEPLNKFLNFVPALPSTVSKSVDSFSMNVVFPLNETGRCTLRQSLRPKNISSTESTIILDIDVYIEKEIKGTDFELLKNEFQQLRQYKNKVFFNVLSEEVIKLFE